MMTPNRKGWLRPALSLPVLVATVAIGCGKGKSDSPSEDGASGGRTAASSGGKNSADGGGSAAGGAASNNSGGVPGSGGAEPPLEPAADCIHPKVVEQCEGDFCRIDAGCFIMGAPPSEYGRAAVDSDQVQVTLTHPFWMGRTEVTRAQWKRTGLPVPKLVQLNGKRECLEEDCPQGNATFYDALRYVNRLSEMEGLKPCYEIAGEGCTGSPITNDYLCPQIKINAKSPYECEGYRLPMEAEWEYAARAGTKTAFPTGDITPQKDDDCYFDAALDQIGWYCKNSPDQAQRVALKPPNGWGLHDMHGNVTELVNDLYGSYGYLGEPYGAKEGPLTNPTGVMQRPNDITAGPDEYRIVRVTRGGTHVSGALSANVSRRFIAFDTDSASTFGFRMARTILDATGGSGGAPP
jgi:formylglycine-generating enzyme